MEPRSRFRRIDFTCLCNLSGRYNKYGFVPARQTENRFLGSFKGLQIRALQLPILSVPRKEFLLLHCTVDCPTKPSVPVVGFPVLDHASIGTVAVVAFQLLLASLLLFLRFSLLLDSLQLFSSCCCMRD